MGTHKDSKHAKVRRMIGNGILSDSDIALCCGVSWSYVQQIKRTMAKETATRIGNVG